jgi:Ran GTPase-activating protein (RanGAP) involved in mRNA processing and transport
MKPAKNIPSQITAPADVAITERKDETIPLHPRQLQLFLQQFNWQEQDLAAAGISSTLLTEEFNRSWYSRLNHWFLREPLLFKILQWPFSKRWPAGSALPTDDECLLRRIYGINGFLAGADLMLNKVWSSLLLSLLTVDIFNYVKYPESRCGNDPLKIFLALSNNEKAVSNALTSVYIWPFMLGAPILWGVLKAFLSVQYARQLDREAYRALLETLGHYQASLWKDIGRWVLPSLLPEFVPNLALFALLPEPKLKLALESAERLLLWDRRISVDERRILLQQVQVLARKATHITQLKALTTLAKVADSIALSDLVRLSQQGVGMETLKSLLWVKQQARQTLQQVAQHLTIPLPLSPLEMQPLINPPSMGDKFTIPSRSRYFFTHYLLWTLGQVHDYRLQPLFWSYLAFQWYFRMRFLLLLGRGIYNLISDPLNELLCESKGMLWIFLEGHAQSECTVCGNLPLFYNDIFNEDNCWNAYLRNPQKASDVIQLIERVKWPDNYALDFTNQTTWSEQDWVDIFDKLTRYAMSIKMLYANTTKPPALTPLNLPAIQAMVVFLKASSIDSLFLANRNISSEGMAILAKALLSSPRSKIQTFDLMHNRLGDKGAEIIGQMLNETEIQNLDLLDNTIGIDGAKALAQGLPGSKVEFLGLGYNQIGDAGIAALSQVLNQSSVESLWLGYTNMSYQGVSVLGKGLLGSRMKYLDLSGNGVGDDAIKELEQKLPDTLTYLNLNNNSLREAGAQSLGEIVAQSKIQELYLLDNSIGDRGTAELGKKLCGSKVQILTLSHNNIGDSGIESLGQCLPESSVKRLFLNYNNISDQGVSGLANQLPKVTVLENLGLAGNKIGDDGAIALGLILNQSSVQVLDLSSNTIGILGAEGLGNGLSGSKVIRLYLGNNRISDAGVKALGPKLPKSQLTWLGLNRNNISDEGTEALFGFQVQTLDLWGNNIGIEGAKRLGERLATLKKLNSLRLQNNNIGQEGAKYLAQYLPQSEVKELDLRSNNIGDEGAEFLAKILITCTSPNAWIKFLLSNEKKGLARAQAHTQLEILRLNGNNITEAGARAICQALPETHIPINNLDLSGNPISAQQVDIKTCYINTSASSTSSANHLQPSGLYVNFYHLSKTTVRYLIRGYQHTIAHWLTALMPPPSAQDQPSLSLDAISDMAKSVSSNITNDVLPKGIIINEPPTMENVPSEINKNEPLFTFKITPTSLAEPSMTTASSSLSAPTNRPSKNPFRFFNGLAKISPPVTDQPHNSNLPALPKLAETLPTVNTLGAIGATVTGVLAVGYWAWKNFKRSSNAMPVSEKKSSFSTRN